MRKSRFSEEQIVRIIQEYAAGAKVSELCRKHGMSDATFYKWKARYGGLQISDVIPPSGMPDSRWGFPSGPISDSMW